MADYMAAVIHIGGKVRHSIVPALCEAINTSGTSLEAGDKRCHFTTPGELLQACVDEGNESLVLKLYDDQARWGEFASLESFLQENGIAFQRWSEGKYEYDATAVAFHPDYGHLEWITNHDRQPIVAASELEPVAAKLTNLLETLKRGKVDAVKVISQIDAIDKELRAALPPAMLPLESLEIVED